MVIVGQMTVIAFSQAFVCSRGFNGVQSGDSGHKSQLGLCASFPSVPASTIHIVPSQRKLGELEDGVGLAYTQLQRCRCILLPIAGSQRHRRRNDAGVPDLRQFLYRGVQRTWTTAPPIKQVHSEVCRKNHAGYSTYPPTSGMQLELAATSPRCHTSSSAVSAA